MQLLKSTFGIIALSFGACLALFVVLSIPPSSWVMLIGIGFGMLVVIPFMFIMSGLLRRQAAEHDRPVRRAAPEYLEYAEDEQYYAFPQPEAYAMPLEDPRYYPLPRQAAPRRPRVAAPMPAPRQMYAPAPRPQAGYYPRMAAPMYDDEPVYANNYANEIPQRGDYAPELYEAEYPVYDPRYDALPQGYAPEADMELYAEQYPAQRQQTQRPAPRPCRRPTPTTGRTRITSNGEQVVEGEFRVME